MHYKSDTCEFYKRLLTVIIGSTRNVNGEQHVKYDHFVLHFILIVFGYFVDLLIV